MQSYIYNTRNILSMQYNMLETFGYNFLNYSYRRN